MTDAEKLAEAIKAFGAIGGSIDEMVTALGVMRQASVATSQQIAKTLEAMKNIGHCPDCGGHPVAWADEGEFHCGCGKVWTATPIGGCGKARPTEWSIVGRRTDDAVPGRG